MLSGDNSIPTPFGQLPAVARVLNVSGDADDSTSWLETSLANDSAMAVKLETVDLSGALTQLRQEFFDAVIIHASDNFDAIECFGPIRTASPDELAIVVIGNKSVEDMTAVCLDAGAEAYVCRHTTNVRTLLWVLARAMERQRLLCAHRTNTQQLQDLRAQQHYEAVHQLRLQRARILEYQTNPHPAEWLVNRFYEILQMLTVSGTENLVSAMNALGSELDATPVSLAELLSAHTLATERLVLTLGKRPAWHILSRANQMLVELLLQYNSCLEASGGSDHPAGCRPSPFTAK